MAIIGVNEVLTKENFWNAIQEKHPKAMKEFCDWVDTYKERVGWRLLFNSDSEYQNAQGKNAVAPKLHELPAFMQIGVFVQFVIERDGYADLDGLYEATVHELKNWIDGMLELRDGNL